MAPYCFRTHVDHEFNKLRSSNSVSVRVKSVGDWWEADRESKLFRLAERALAREWNVQPLFVREGGTMPVCRAQLNVVRRAGHVLLYAWLAQVAA